MTFEVPGVRGRDQERTWIECVKQDVYTHNLNVVDPHDRNKWLKQIKESVVLPIPDSGTTVAL